MYERKRKKIVCIPTIYTFNIVSQTGMLYALQRAVILLKRPLGRARSSSCFERQMMMHLGIRDPWLYN